MTLRLLLGSLEADHEGLFSFSPAGGDLRARVRRSLAVLVELRPWRWAWTGLLPDGSGAHMAALDPEGTQLGNASRRSSGRQAITQGRLLARLLPSGWRALPPSDWRLLSGTKQTVDKLPFASTSVRRVNADLGNHLL